MKLKYMEKSLARVDWMVQMSTMTPKSVMFTVDVTAPHEAAAGAAENQEAGLFERERVERGLPGKRLLNEIVRSTCVLSHPFC